MQEVKGVLLILTPQKWGVIITKKMFKNSLLIYAPLRDFGGMWRCKDMGSRGYY